jgi:hypothetical protein
MLDDCREKMLDDCREKIKLTDAGSHFNAPFPSNSRPHTLVAQGRMHQ